MKSAHEMRTEKSLLSSHISKCRQYKEMLSESYKEIAGMHQSGMITREEYLKKVNEGLKGKSYGYFHNYYDSLIDCYESKINKIDGELKVRKHNAIVIIVIMLLAVAAFMNPAMTGNVVFSVTEQIPDNEMIEFVSDSLYELDAAGINAIHLTGRYEGEGSVNVYLVADDIEWLVYTAEQSSEFRGQCGNACFISENYDKYMLRVEIGDGKIEIERIDYMLSDLREFSLDKNKAEYVMNDTRYIKDKFLIHNKYGHEAHFAVYGEGELTEYLTLNQAILELGENESKEIIYDIDLPLDIKPGEYNEKIIVRFLAEDEFKGETPIEEFEINVKVLGDKGYMNMILFVLAIVFLINILFFFLKKKKDKSAL